MFTKSVLPLFFVITLSAIVNSAPADSKIDQPAGVVEKSPGVAASESADLEKAESAYLGYPYASPYYGYGYPYASYPYVKTVYPYAYPYTYPYYSYSYYNKYPAFYH